MAALLESVLSSSARLSPVVPMRLRKPDPAVAAALPLSVVIAPITKELLVVGVALLLVTVGPVPILVDAVSSE